MGTCFGVEVQVRPGIYTISPSKCCGCPAISGIWLHLPELNQRGLFRAPGDASYTIINAQNLDLVYKGFQTVYSDAYLKADVNWEKIAMKVPSTGSEETYGWMGLFPQLREWIGPRHVKNLAATAFTIKNRKFESTVAVPRDEISDDKLGVFKPPFSEMGYMARTHPEELIFSLHANGFTTTGFDGQNFFDTNHPVLDKDGDTVSVSNTASGAGPAWFLLDNSRGIQPIIWQERETYDFQSMTDPDNPHVFLNDEYVYGVRARVNAGFGLWQLFYGSTDVLNEANYTAAQQALMNSRRRVDQGTGYAGGWPLGPGGMDGAGARVDRQPRIPLSQPVHAGGQDQPEGRAPHGRGTGSQSRPAYRRTRQSGGPNGRCN